MKKMDDELLLAHLQTLEQDSAAFTWGRLGTERAKGMREYFREPYGTEVDGLSGIVTSEVQDTIEWILPDLLDVFCSTEKAVCFDPTNAEDVKGAEQATDACNYIFYKQNNGFLVLYTAFKDALMNKNCAVTWRKEEQRVKTIIPVSGATQEELAMVLQDAGEDAEIEAAREIPGQVLIDPMTGQQVMRPARYDARISKIEKKKKIVVEAFPPENLLIKRDWTSPLLQDCPYVCRNMAVSLSELHEMGYTDVTAEELRGSDDAGISSDTSYRSNRRGSSEEQYGDNPLMADQDDSQTMGFLRIEYVLVDFDGDGISERRCIYRLKDKILKNEEASHVPFCTASPILIQHRWDGMSIAECVSDLQLLGTEITRQTIDSGRLALQPRTKVLTDTNGSPLANIDDLLDHRAGGIIRQSRVDAVTEQITPFVGGQMFSLLEYKDQMLTKRTGVSGQSQGLDVNALNRGGAYEQRVMNAAQKRIKLIARIFAELLVKPMFQGVLKLLTDGDMEKISIRLRNEFVQYDPMEWRDSYDMTANVGLGTGDRDYQTAVLTGVAQRQAGIAMSPFGKLLVLPKHIYNTEARLLEYAGFKNAGDFFNDPGDQVPQPQPPAPPPQVLVKQMELAADAQKFQALSAQEKEIETLKHQAKIQETQAQLELQALNDRRDSERELLKAQHDAAMADMQAQLERYKIDQDNQTKILVAQIAHPVMPEAPEDDEKDDAKESAAVAKDIQIIRDATGKMERLVVTPIASTLQ
jgi:hypothetical protein